MIPALNALSLLLASVAYLVEFGLGWTIVSSTCATVFIQNVAVLVPALAIFSATAIGLQLLAQLIGRSAGASRHTRFAALPIPTMLSFLAGALAADTLRAWL